METTDFKTLLNKTVVSAGLAAEEQVKIMEPLLSYTREHIPSKLYKYRSFCDNHISAFYKDQVWVSTAQSMNDGFDARLYFDKKDSIELYKQQTTPDKIAAFINMMKTDEVLKDEVSRLPGAETALQYLNLSDSIIQQGIKDSKDRITPIIMEMIEKLPEITQQSLKFCCFSETVTSASMWGQYSNNEKGFCLEYDFRNTETRYYTPSGTNVSISLFPMIYDEERYQVPGTFINYLLQYRLYNENASISGHYTNDKEIRDHVDSVLKCPDLLVSTKIALHKSLEWQFEKEWRLFCNAVGNAKFEQASHGCIVKKPKAVYLGRRVSETNERIMRGLAQEKSIPVYKMMLDDDSPTYELIYKLN